MATTKSRTLKYTANTFEESGSNLELEIPEGFTEIGMHTFSKVRDTLKSVVFPSTMRLIPNKLFKDCTNLETVIFNGSKINEIPEEFCIGCKKLQKVVMPEGLTKIGSAAFYECSSLQNITIPAGVTTIESHAFSYCNSLQSFTFPDGVTSIGSYAFYDCTSLQSIEIPNDNP